MGSPDERNCWFNVQLTEGLGPAAAQKIAARLNEMNSSIASLRDQSPDELQRLGLSAGVSRALASRLADPVEIPNATHGVHLLLPSDEAFPLDRFLTSNPPMPPALWLAGDVSLVSFQGPTLGIAGSRDTSERVMESVYEVAQTASSMGWLVISGLAQGVDSAAHRGAISGGTGTVAVIASGLLKLDQHWMSDDIEPIAFVSEFDPDAPWSGRRAMQRNSTIASFSDRVVVAAAGLSGGSWEMAQLCLKRKKELFVLDLPETEADGNQRLIRAGANPISVADLGACLAPPAEPLTLFD